MSDLPREALSYEVVVAEYFLGLRGSGLMLSPLDAEQVRAWRERGVPAAVVCRGLRHGHERAMAELPPGAAPPRSLRALRLAVEDEWRAYRSGRVAGAADPDDGGAGEPAQGPLERAAAATREAPEGGLREVYARAAAALAALAATGAPAHAVEAVAAAADDEALRAWARGLAGADRAALGRFCAVRAGPRGRGCTWAAHREALRAHARDFARGAGLTLLRGSV